MSHMWRVVTALVTVRALRMPDDYVVHGTEGTYHFFSPEMCASGYKGHDGRRADIWATGISLWGFLFRSLPFLHKACGTSWPGCPVYALHLSLLKRQDLPALLDTIAMGTYELPACDLPAKGDLTCRDREIKFAASCPSCIFELSPSLNQSIASRYL